MYSPLDSESDEIRIVHLHPAPSHSSPIQCSLHRVSLENNPEYTALSYTWGSPIKLPWWERIRSKKRTIWVDGVEVVVTANLASALEQLRTTDSDEWESLPPRKFWIDALSINQNDDDEKAQQVQKMRIIYERAKDTIVWLGPSRNGSDEALKFIDRAGHEDNTDNFSDPRLWKTIPGKELEALWGRTYWRRIWVLQEIYQSRNIILQCGDIAIPFSRVANIAQKEIHYHEKLDQHLEQLYLHRGHGEYKDAPSWYIAPVELAFVEILGSLMPVVTRNNARTEGKLANISTPNLLHSWSDAVSNGFEMGLIHETWSALYVSNAYRPTMNNWIKRTNSFESTLPRDRVFALLGIARQSERGSIKVDYSDATSDAEIFTNVIRCILSETLEPLRWVQYLPLSQRLSGLPSWVFDMSRPRDYSVFRGPVAMTPSSNFQADGGIHNWARLCASRTIGLDIPETVFRKVPKSLLSAIFQHKRLAFYSDLRTLAIQGLHVDIVDQVYSGQNYARAGQNELNYLLRSPYSTFLRPEVLNNTMVFEQWRTAAMASRTIYSDPKEAFLRTLLHDMDGVLADPRTSIGWIHTAYEGLLAYERVLAMYCCPLDYVTLLSIYETAKTNPLKYPSLSSLASVHTQVKMTHFSGSALEKTNGRKFFISEGGYMGLAPMETEKG